MDPITMMAIAAALGLLGGGVSSFGQANQQKQAAEAQVPVRSRLLQSIQRLRNPDHSGLEAGASRAFTKQADSADAAAAHSGTLGSGSQELLKGEMLANVQAALAQAIMQDEVQREQTIASILQDESFSTLDPSQINVPLMTILGALTGAAGGAGGVAGGIAANPEGFKTQSKTVNDVVDPGTSTSNLQRIFDPTHTSSITTQQAGTQGGTTFSQNVAALLPSRPNVQQTIRR